MDDSIESLLDYWFGSEPSTKKMVDERYERWFIGSAVIDADIASRFGTLARRAADGELDDWAATARGRLALILLLDQMPRHLHRGTAAAFEQDEKAMHLTRTGMDAGMDRELHVLQRAFFYMPLQHAESTEAQELSVQRFEGLAADPSTEKHLQPVLQSFAEYARMHRDIVLRFGRFPHRNRPLGRTNTVVEEGFLREGAETFGQ